ncbi:MULTISPECIES: hypothetical protein [Streptomyces]|uniref:hypothetical protein n=1 Tax=Streptomyces TaxID=1883 RepID=UPI00131C911D|nr:hypothetical protein [Streptomyces sp. NRRL S-15]
MGDQATAPVAEGGSGLTFPVDTLDEVAQFPRRFLDCVPGLPQRLTRLFELLRLGVLDQVDHRVDLVVLEGGPSRRPGASGEESAQAFPHGTADVRLTHLDLDRGLVLLLLFGRSQFRLLLVTHQLSPKSS